MSSEPIFKHTPGESPDAAFANSVERVLLEVARERGRQQAKWGQQDHPSAFTTYMCWPYGMDSEDVKRYVDNSDHMGIADYAGILAEEFAEALDAETIEHVREELVQVAAVAVAAIESIDRNGR